MLKCVIESANIVNILLQRVGFMEKSILLSCDEFHIPVKVDTSGFGDIKRIVLGVHGIGGSSQDQIQTGLAEEMSMFGAAMVRFDFPGHGQSDIDRFTLDGCCKTLLKVAEFARGEFPDVEDLCIFATGFGAYVTLVCLDALQQMSGNVRLVVQTPSVRMDQTLLRMIRKTEQTFRVQESHVLAAERPLTVTYDFYKELRQNVALDSYDMPILILQGEMDDYIPLDDILNFRRINEDARLVFIPGASHRFLEPGVWDMVLDLTRDWFSCEQVLLCDWQ